MNKRGITISIMDNKHFYTRVHDDFVKMFTRDKPKQCATSKKNNFRPSRLGLFFSLIARNAQK